MENLIEQTIAGLKVMATEENNEDSGNHAIVLGLSALGWTLQDPARSDRLLALTGLSVSDLRSSADQPATLAAVIEFLGNHEPDLLACAQALKCDPQELVRAKALLETIRI